MKKKIIGIVLALCCFLQVLPLSVVKALNPPVSDQYVINLVIDGLSNSVYDQAKQAGLLTPNIDKLLANGTRLRGVDTTIPAYFGSEVAALTGAGSKTNGFMYRYYDKRANSVTADSFSMNAQTVFEKLKLSNIRTLASGWIIGNKSIEGRGVSASDPDHLFTAHGTNGDNLIKFDDVSADVVTAIQSADMPRFISAYSNDIKKISYDTVESDTNAAKKYAAALTDIDTKLGDILNALDAKGITSQTTIVLNSLAPTSKVASKATTATLSTNITADTGVKAVEVGNSGGTAVAVTDTSAKVVIVKQYMMHNTTISFTNLATDDDKAKVLSYLNNKSSNAGKVIDKVYSAADLGLSDTYCDYLLTPVAGKSFASCATGIYRVGDLKDSKVFCVLSGNSIPKGYDVQDNATIKDLAPTICSWLGCTAPDNSEGQVWNFVPAAPVVTLTYPSTDTIVVNPNMTITGSVNEDCTFKVNDNNISLNADKTFSAAVTLKEGDNTVTIQASNSYGKTTILTRKVTYMKRETPPAGNTVVYINWDGCANYYIDLAKAQNKIPNLTKIMTSDGVYFPNAFTRTPSITDPMQTSIVSGTTTKFTDNSYRYFNKLKNIVVQETPGRKDMAETIGESAVRQNLDIISINQFALENRGAVAGDPFKDYYSAPAGSNGYSDGAARFDAAIDLVKNLRAGSTKLFSLPRFISVYMDDIDGIGHNETPEYGQPTATTETQREQMIVDHLQMMDAKLGEFIQACKDASAYDNMDFVLTADHGMANFGLQESSSDDSISSKLPDLMDTINSLGSDYKVQYLYPNASMQAPAADTKIALVSCGLQVQLSYINECNPDVIAAKNKKIMEAIKDKSYVDIILQPDQIKELGAKEGFADLIISPKTPYHFMPSSVGTDLLVARGAHDSLSDRAQRITAFMWGKDIKKGYSDTETIHNTDFAATMSYLMGVNAPLDSTGKIIYSALDGKSAAAEYKTTVEAETAQTSGNSEKLLDSSASNGAYVGNTDSDKASVEFTGVPASKRMEVHYAAAQDGLMTLMVNGKAIRDVFFPTNNVSSGKYDTKVINYTLNKGDSVQFVTNKSANGVGVSFDSIDFYSESQQTPDPSGDTGKPYDINMTPNGDTKTEIGFAWFTDSGVTGTKVQVIKATGETADFSKDATEFNGISQNVTLKQSGTNTNYVSHKAKATGLASGAKYFYRVGDGTTWSETGSFTTSSDKDFTFLFLTDPQGYTSDSYDLWAKTMQSAVNTFPNASFMAVGGDMINTGLTSPNDEQEWSYYFGKKQNIFLNLPTAPVVGNHEGRNNANYEDHFNLPNNATVQTFPSNAVYSFDYGNAHFSVLDTEMLLTAEDFQSQIDWLKKNMMQTSKKWKILMLHKPLYSGGEHCAYAD
ncbi:MAG: alkaline phosphatase family protein, partial [Bacillota bacterium]|nr:alkaline phosphatase family protein [Bacillota bacterium]